MTCTPILSRDQKRKDWFLNEMSYLGTLTYAFIVQNDPNSAYRTARLAAFVARCFSE